MPWRTFGPKSDKATGGRRTLYNEELHAMYSSPNIIRIIKSRRMRLARSFSSNGEKMNSYRLLARKPEGNRPVRKHRRRWVDNIKMNFVQIRLVSVDWICLAHDSDECRALVNAVMKLRGL
jgi:hypothetical protein